MIPTTITRNTYMEYFILIPKKVYKRIIGVSAKNIIKTYLLKLIPVKVEKKQITSEGTSLQVSLYRGIIKYLYK